MHRRTARMFYIMKSLFSFLSRFVFALAFAPIVLTGIGVEAKEERWVGTWAASPQLTEPANTPPPPGLTDATLRQIVHVSLGGKRIRVRFSNAFGLKPLKILAARVAASNRGSQIEPETDKPLMFGDRVSIVIPPGAMMISDPLDFNLACLSNLAVTIHVNDSTKTITGHPGSRCTSYLDVGDQTKAHDLPRAVSVLHWYYLCGVDVEAPDAQFYSVAVLGDSITDGRGSPTDGDGRWTDHLARRLQQNQAVFHVGILNQGLGGNRLLNDGLGPNVIARLDRDVLAQPGIRALIVFEGINDLGTRSATATDIINAYNQIIIRAHDRGLRVYGATITPCQGSFYFRTELEADRQKINAWIRESGRFDAVIDFDTATRDPEKPSRLSTAVDGGDHLHPGAEGYKIMANAVDFKLFK